MASQSNQGALLALLTASDVIFDEDKLLALAPSPRDFLPLLSSRVPSASPLSPSALLGKTAELRNLLAVWSWCLGLPSRTSGRDSLDSKLCSRINELLRLVVDGALGPQSGLGGLVERMNLSEVHTSLLFVQCLR